MIDSVDLQLNGKLLLTGEYFVLDGVPGFAVPTRLGQRFRATPDGIGRLTWVARDVHGEEWFRGTFGPAGSLSASDPAVARRLWEILLAAEGLRPGVLKHVLAGYTVRTDLQFDRHWGLGSSSTLIAGVARWLEVDPYALLEATFGGSGYDLACAVNNQPIIYRRYQRNYARVMGSRGTHLSQVQRVKWEPGWKDQTYFIYRNEKQNSRDGIRAYREREVPEGVKTEIAELTLALALPPPHLRAAAQLLERHEELVSRTLGLRTVKEELFPDFPGTLKSLGAWGGDFVWALSEEPAEKITAYFNARGYPTVIPYAGMILPAPASK